MLGEALLVGGFKHGFYFPFHIWDNPNPIDELHHFSRWLLHHQPVYKLVYKSHEYYRIIEYCRYITYKP